MRQENTYTYKDFYRETAKKPNKTEEGQKRDILCNIDKLYSQKDFWSLEALLKILRALTNEEAVEKGYALFFAISELGTVDIRALTFIQRFLMAYRGGTQS